MTNQKLIKLIDTDGDTVIVKAAKVTAMLAVGTANHATTVCLNNESRINLKTPYSDLEVMLNEDGTYATFFDPDEDTEILAVKSGIYNLHGVERRKATIIRYEDGTDLIVKGTPDEVAEKLDFI
ncbi:hypothetical protein ACNGTO_03160 [Bisgaard Taxon 45]